jgi:hypothetical protein
MTISQDKARKLIHNEPQLDEYESHHCDLDGGWQ